MRESVIYQEWRAEALSEGRTEGRAEGRAEGLQRERDLVLRLLTRRLGDLSPDVIQQVQGLPIEAVEALGEALLDFSQLNELFLWLEQQQA